MSAEQTGSESHRFLTAERITEIGERVEPLIRDGLLWAERRTETVAILDDTALRRKLSVDFSLRRPTPPLLPAEEGTPERLYCAPAFALPKAPANLMAFDLTDETGRSLHLISRMDNARISGVALCCMARRVLQAAQMDVPTNLTDELDRIAQAGADEGEQRARRLQASPDQAYAEQTAVLQQDERFTWWLSTFAHSSIVAVLFRATKPRRKIIKLTFEQPIESELRLRTSLGWDPYSVWVDSPLIEARTFHFEAEAPHGLRILEARLSDDGDADAVIDRGSLRRIHLYRENAVTAGAGTSLMRIRVSASFAGGAVLAAALTALAIVACSIFANVIAMNPTSAPALLLFTPGFIATYIARPEPHPLTARLLSSARWLLIGAAFLAFVAAATVVLSGAPVHSEVAVQERTESLRLWLVPLAALAIGVSVALSITFVRGHWPVELRRSGGYSDRRFMAAPNNRVANYLKAGSLVPAGYKLVDDAGEIVFVRRPWHGDWVLVVSLCAAEQGDGCWVELENTYTSRGGGIWPRWLGKKDRRVAQEFTAALQTWAVESA